MADEDEITNLEGEDDEEFDDEDYSEEPYDAASFTEPSTRIRNETVHVGRNEGGSSCGGCASGPPPRLHFAGTRTSSRAP